MEFELKTSSLETNTFLEETMPTNKKSNDLHVESDSSQTTTALLLKQIELLTNSGTWELNLETKKLTWSEGILRMLGYDPQEFDVNFESALERIHPDDRKASVNHLQEVLHEEKEYNIKKRLVKKDGKIIWVVAKASIVSDPSSGQRKLIGVFQDITEFIQTKEKLKTVKKKNKSLIENLDGIFWEADAQTLAFTYVSPQVEEITGFTPKEWLDTKNFWQSQIHPDDRADSIQLCHNETQQLKDHVFDYRFMTKSGKVIWLNDRVKVISKNGKPVKLQGMMVDVTQFKETAEALKEEIGLNQSLIQNLPSVFFLFRPNGKFLLWNHQLEIESDFTPEQVARMVPEDFFSSSSHETVKKHIQRVLEEGSADFELEIVTFSGQKVPFLFSVSRVNYKGKICLLGSGQNITELVESRKSAAQHIERYEIVTQATSDAIWDFDRTKNSLYWGEGFLSLFGYDPKKTETSFEYLLSLIHPEDRDRILALVQTYLNPFSTKRNWLEEYRFKKSDGSYAFVLDKAIFMRDDKSGYVQRVVGAIQDISNQKEAEKSLKNLNEQLEKKVRELAISNLELEQFAFVASHDLQEPLRMISSFMGLLERRYKGVLDEKALEYISFATNGAKQMQKVILDLLQLSRVGRVNENKEFLDLEALIEEVKLYLRKPISEKKAVITTANLPQIHSLRTPILQVFQNLIGNSIKYSKSGINPEVNISCVDLTTHWQFTIKDNGIGIDPEYFNKIFIVFQRLHDRKEFDGTGIGLSIVKKAVEFLDGEISVVSEIDKGAEFIFTIKK